LFCETHDNNGGKRVPLVVSCSVVRNSFCIARLGESTLLPNNKSDIVPVMTCLRCMKTDLVEEQEGESEHEQSLKH
jgi:hypothetical protein